MSQGDSWDVDMGGSSSRKSLSSKIPSQSPGPGASRFSRPAPRTRAADDSIGAGGASPSRGVSTPIATTRSSKIFKEGELVKVKRKPPKPGYEDGKIVSKNFDGTYDVRSSDTGVTERNIPAARIVAMPDASAGGEGESKADGEAVHAAANFRMGQKVEGMHPKTGKWTAAKVLGVNTQRGTLDIRFENGDDEKNGK